MTTIANRFDEAQSRAFAHPPGGDGLAITGPAGSGKTFVLLARAHDIAARTSRRVLVLSPVPAAVTRLREHLRAPSVACSTIAALAFEILRADRPFGRGERPLKLIDDARAAHRFESVGAALFALEWTEFAAAELDPEITGLRAPERFAATAFRLFRKLRAALVTPADFKTSGLRGAAEFYGHPPNFASADLIVETPPKYRDSIRVTPQELERQRAREIDLVKILARLYASYCDDVLATGELTPGDAVYEATHRLQADARARENARETYPFALVDDAQELTDGEVAFLETTYGERFAGVTIAGDERQRVRGFGGGARLGAFRRTPHTIAFSGSYRGTTAIANAACIALGKNERPRTSFEGVALYRADSQRDEARFVAGEIARAIASGIAPERIALVARNLSCAHPYVDALLARDVPTDLAGTACLYEFPTTLDALAALWATVDPFRHEFLLRNLEAPWLRLSDASIAVLCAEPAIAQPLLFESVDATQETDGRSDRKRDLRLGRNVTRGDADTALADDARARIVAFREALERWQDAARSFDLPVLARLVLAETAFATLPAGARGRFEAGLLERLLAAIDAYAERHPLATLYDFLVHAERLAGGEGDLLVIDAHDAAAVRVCDVETLAGATYERVFVVDVKAGAWPRYYVPDAFLFSPKYGMIPKDNVGDADAARTAKFTWATARMKYRTQYNDEDRRALYLAATRARNGLCVTASGRSTQGKNTPELLTELERARDFIGS